MGIWILKSAITLERMVRALNPWPERFLDSPLRERPCRRRGEGCIPNFQNPQARILHPQIGCAADLALSTLAHRT